MAGRVTEGSLPRLTSLRYVAALMVVATHLAEFVLPRSRVSGFASYGFVGVGFFFVLSGFVLTWNRRENLPKRYFYGRRFARIYPLHLLTALVAVPVLLAISHPVEHLSAFANVFLLHPWVPRYTWDDSLNAVSWSLGCEAFFYAMFPFIAAWVADLRPRQVVLGAAAYLVVGYAVVVTVLPAAVAGLVVYYDPALRFGEFVLGIGLAMAVRGGRRSPLRLPLALALLLPALLASRLLDRAVEGVLPPTRGIAMLVFTPVFCLVILAGATADLERRPGPLATPLAARLGEISFALYMVHYLPLLVWGHVVGRVGSLTTGLALGLAYVVLVTLVSESVHRWFEHPIERRLRARIGTPPRT